MTCRNFSFTSFNTLNPPITFTDNVRYVCYQIEIAPTTLTPHLQGYIQFRNPVRSTAVGKIFGSTTHVEKSKGSPDENIAYCTKLSTRKSDTNPFTYGTPATQGERSDIHNIVVYSLTHTIQETALEYPTEYVKFHRGLDALKMHTLAPRCFPPDVVWIYGSAGVGKTRYVYDHWKSVYSKPPDTLWFDGYQQQECLLIDDFDGYIHFKYLLQLLDRYPLLVAIKGGYTQFNSPHIVITSDATPAQTYPHESDITQLTRRITTIINLKPLPPKIIE